MKKITKPLALLLVLATLCAVLPTAYADPTSGQLINSDIVWKLSNDGTVLTITGSGELLSNDYYYHDTAPWYPFRYTVETVVIGNGITYIGRRAFQNFHELKSVSIPDSVTEITNEAFRDCEQLQSVRLPAGLRWLDSEAFLGCASLSSVEIPSGVKVLYAVFKNCTALKSVTLHEGLEELQNSCFAGTSLTQIQLPSTLKKIGEKAFGNCSSLTSVELPEGLEELDLGAFCGAGLKTLVLPESLQTATGNFFGGAAPESVVVKSKSCAYTSQNPFSGMEGGTVYAYLDSKTYQRWGNTIYRFRPLYFSDVLPGTWSFDAVSFAKENELFEGVSKTEFNPGGIMTRAMAVTVLWRYAGANTQPSGGSSAFTDVKPGSWYADAVQWASEQGIVNGVGDGRFNPNGKLTREQLVAILYRFTTAAEPGGSSALQDFADAGKVSNYAKDAMCWAVDLGLLTGIKADGKTVISPSGSATRAQVAAIMMRYVQNVRTVLYAYTDELYQPILQKAAEEYERLHPELEIRVVQTDPTDFARNYLYDGKRDLYLAHGMWDREILGGYDGEKINVMCNPYCFVAAPDDPLQIGDLDGMIRRARSGEITFGVQEGSMPLKQFALKVLEKEGVGYERYSREFKTKTYEDSAQITAAILDGSVDTGVVTASDAVANGLFCFYQPDTINGVYADLIFAVLPRASRHPKEAAAFVAWIKEQAGEPFFADLGYLPLAEGVI